LIEFLLPSLGADMDEGMLVGWLVAPGDEVRRGQIIAEVETEKGIIEVECWVDAVVEELLVQPSKTPLAVGTPLAHLSPLVAAEPVAAPAAAAPAAAAAAEPVAAPPPQVPLPAIPCPPIRHLAHELGVDLALVAPTGPGGVITRDDIREAAAAVAADGAGGRPRATPLARKLAASAGVDLASLTARRADGLISAADVGATTLPPRFAEPATEGDGGVDDRAAGMRRAIARAMARSKREIPHYYVGTAIDVGTLMTWIDEENTQRPMARRLLPAAALLKATALALAEYPDLNGHMVDDRYTPAETVHLGVAVSLREGGLIAPAIHDAQRLSLDEMMEALRDLVGRARAWRLRSSEMSDPTVTVTNLGDRGVEVVYPVIVPPQVAIIGMGRIVERPWVRDGVIVVRPILNTTLGADHRVSDGHRGGLFLATIDRLLQEPERL
jgi:pyruvate dehydrogenase E2 component (dihydrolipoamide acetyltransferase)